MKYAIAALLVSIGVAAPAGGRAESWAVYHDGLHECRLEYANSLFTQDEMDSDNFQRFAGRNKDTYFRVKALPNEEKWTPEQIMAEYTKARGMTDVVYERTKTDFLVISGFRGGNIFYTKVALSGDNETICVLDISYPRKAKRAFDAIVTRNVAVVRRGELIDSHPAQGPRAAC